MHVESFVLGGLVVAWVLGLAAVAYTLWRYAYVPFRVVRADVAELRSRQDATKAALEQQIQLVQTELGLRKALTLSDEDQARAEMRLRARRLWPPPDLAVPREPEARR